MTTTRRSHNETIATRRARLNGGGERQALNKEHTATVCVTRTKTKEAIKGGLNFTSKLYGKDVDETQEGSITETNYPLSFLLICGEELMPRQHTSVQE